ncbi:MAG: hypothetical protein AAF542_13715 [Pseudomonadota bacterium]
MLNPTAQRGSNVLPFRRHTERFDATRLELGDSSGSALELLFGTLQFIGQSSEQWVTWVNPPESHKSFFNRDDLSVDHLRFVYKDQQRSVFHLLYLALQAANSSWVIGPAQELSFRETEILEQAARHNSCKLLLISERVSVH